jgi:K+-sensing histidine kinase KdpD
VRVPGNVIPGRRRVAAVALAALGLPLATVALLPMRDDLEVPTILLLFLLLVVAVAAIGGTGPALLGAVAAFLVLNWWFTPPYRTWTVDEREHVVALVVFLVVAGVVSFAMTTAARRAVEATEARADAETLARGNDLRTAILTAVSHDLRTPLASIKASVSSLRAGDVAWTFAEVKEFLATIEDETDRLDGLVGNLLDMSRIQTGTLELTKRAIGLEEVVAASLASLGSRAPTVDLGVAEDLPRVLADPGLLERSVANLLSNAAAWSPPGRDVQVDAERRGRDRVALRIIDHGRGIPAGDHDRVFLPFQRLGDSGRGGVGLGLAVARGFVVAMNGELVVEETPGGGVTMVVLLPVAR